MSLVVLILGLKNCTAVAEVKLVAESRAKELHSKAWQSCPFLKIRAKIGDLC